MNLPKICVALSLLLLSSSAVVASEDKLNTWEHVLKTQYFPTRAITVSDSVIQLDAPQRAENGAVVPIKIIAKIPQQPHRYIQTVTLLIDENPVPLVGIFNFTPLSGRADLDLRVRLNAYSMIRAVAEMNTGELFMTERYVKASGGCSAPVGTNLELAMQRLGKIKVRSKLSQLTGVDGPVQHTQLAISHPNITGMQMDQQTLLYAPAHFVKDVKVTFNGDLVFSAQTDISISENPNYKFFFVPEQAGNLIAEVTDSNGLQFSQSYQVNPAEPTPAENIAAH